MPPPDAPEVPEPAPPVEIAPVPLAEAAPANGAAASLWVSPFEQPLPANGSTVPPRVLWRASPMQLLVAAASLVGVALVAVISAIVISFGRPTRVASVAAAAPASACPEPAAAPVPPPVETAAATPPAAIPFSVAAARRALDATSHDVAKCKRGKRWGSAFATVTFDEDGSVSHVAVGGPFAGTQTGACVVDGLSAAHVTPFEGKPGVVVYRFYVAPR